MRKTTPATRNPARSNRILPVIGVVLLLLAFGAYLLKDAFVPTVKQSPMDSSTESPSDPFRHDGQVVFSSQTGARLSEIAVEIADRDESRTQGLMGRTMLQEDRGMLFLFDDSEPRSFWMANTPLPLDIIFVGPDYRIVKIHRSTSPFSEESLESGAAARYVVEVNGGYCARHGVSEGDRIEWRRR
jgi:uncharacterized membrane protein (UPF0127 family)